MEKGLGCAQYSEPDLTIHEHSDRVDVYELKHLRAMIVLVISSSEHFKQRFGHFATTLCHRQDISPAKPPYEEEDVWDVLMGGASLL